jgi:hypothetical protein
MQHQPESSALLVQDGRAFAAGIGRTVEKIARAVRHAGKSLVMAQSGF